MMREICEIMVNGNTKPSRSASTALFLRALLETGVVEHLFTMVDWASQVLLAYDKDQSDKLLLHQQVLNECLMAPMSLLSLLISGEWLKRGELKYYL